MMIINGTLIRNVESMVIVYAKHIGHCLYKKNFQKQIAAKNAQFRLNDLVQ